MTNDSNMQGLRLAARLCSVYKPFRAAIAAMCVFTIALQLAGLWTISLFGRVVDTLKPGNGLGVMLAAGLGWLGIELLLIALSYLQESWGIRRFGFEVQRDLSRETVARVLGFSVGQRRSQNSALIQAVAATGEGAITSLAYMLVYDIFPLLFKVCLTVGMLLYLDLALGGIVLAAVCSAVAVSAVTHARLRDPIIALNDEQNELRRFQTEILRCTETVCLNAQEERMVREYDSLLEAFAGRGKRLWVRHARFNLLGRGLTKVAQFSVLAIAIYGFSRGRYSVGEIVAFWGWSASVFGEMAGFTPKLRTLSELFASIRRYCGLLDSPPEIRNAANPLRPRLQGRIEFRAVSFSHPSRNGTASGGPVRARTLSNVSFAIEPGSTTAIVGHSGAGKSTVIDLLLRSFDPHEGQVLIDGYDLRDLDLQHFRRHVGIVEQNISLFDNTLRYNVLFGMNANKSLGEPDRLDYISRTACLDRVLARLEYGFDTNVGERAVKLSGGERQRIGIARALIKDPAILIFDEATSNLDSENESLISAAVTELSKKGTKTVLLIAHRLSTVKHADKILVLDDGTLVGEGSHAQLLESCALYRNLVLRQAA